MSAAELSALLGEPLTYTSSGDTATPGNPQRDCNFASAHGDVVVTTTSLAARIASAKASGNLDPSLAHDWPSYISIPGTKPFQGSLLWARFRAISDRAASVEVASPKEYVRVFVSKKTGAPAHLGSQATWRPLVRSLEARLS